MPALVLNSNGIITLAGNHDRKSTELKELFLRPPILQTISHGRTPGVNWYKTICPP